MMKVLACLICLMVGVAVLSFFASATAADDTYAAYRSYDALSGGEKDKCKNDEGEVQEAMSQTGSMHRPAQTIAHSATESGA